MATTANRNYPLPEAGSSVKDEIERLQQATLPMLDGDVQALFDAVNGLSEIGHKHPISDVEGLSAALAAKMPASKTFSIGELSGVVGADDAPDGYVLVKVGEEWVAQAALSALGSHDHVIADVSGLGDALDTLTEAASGAQATADEAKGAAVPIGIVFIQNGPVDPGYLRFGEGGSYDRASYPDLAAWMDANGQTAFGLTPTQIANGEFPDWRDHSPRTAGGPLGPSVGALQLDAMQGHRHAEKWNGILGNFYTSGASGQVRNSAGTPPSVDPPAGYNGIFDPITDGTNGIPRTASETRVKSFGVRWQIKAYGAFVGGGTADLVAIQQDVQTVKNGAVRKDVDQSGSYGVPEKVTILKNTLQAWEIVPGGVIAQLVSTVAYLEWAGTLGDYYMLRLKGVFVPTVNDTILNCQMGFGGVDTGANYGHQNVSAQSTALNASTVSATSQMPLSASARTTAGSHASIDVSIARFNKPTVVRVNALSGAYTTLANLSMFTAYHSTPAARDTLRLLASSGNIGAGSSFVLEGMRG
ncbi:Phage tail fiber protein [Devosia sp. H5989]|nr:Phage tail fiber protein [Devosia sp. H5989]